MDWRLGRGRVMFLFNMEECLARVRAASGGKLPLFLDTWEEILAFAGEARIALPELEEVARGLVVSSVAYPTIQWVADQYAKFLLYVAENPATRDLLKDPDPVTEVVPLQFPQIMEQSVSNLEDAGIPCSEPPPAIFSPTGMSPGSPNTLSTGTRRFPKVLLKSTPTLVPKHLCERLPAT